MHGYLPVQVRFAGLMHDLWARAPRQPTCCRRLLERCDAFRKPARFGEILLACECDARGRLGFEDRPYPQRERLAQVLLAAQSVATAEVAERAMAAGLTGQKVGELIHAARVAAVAALPG